ncbi:pyrophosphatase [Compostimonas suwonensis]|uniref:Phosphoribosyl-ATP pyrophosphohydrolase n=1 Tax=Compostimonas suwonensis TaxID=1048394 RepID=A0A2M9BWF0_9MICO|nr:pyrophosphatase [Compostimonas suwonensis]PJJ62270.1 phosphoribosyl-ATP pyrophosphohydrolase [Compostimonas suwonensis]
MHIEEISSSVEDVSQGYAAKFAIERSEVWFLLKLQEELGELTQAFVNLKGMSKDRGQSDEERRIAFAHECADVLAHLLLLARHEGVDVEAAITDKWLRWAVTRDE